MHTVAAWLGLGKHAHTCCCALLHRNCDENKQGNILYTAKVPMDYTKFLKNIPYLPVKEIDFTSAKKQHKKFTCEASKQKEVLNTGITTAPRRIGTSSHINKQSRDSKLDSFLKKSMSHRRQKFEFGFGSNRSDFDFNANYLLSPYLSKNLLCHQLY